MSRCLSISANRLGGKFNVEVRCICDYHLSIDKSTIEFGYNGGKYIVFVKSNTTWRVKEGNVVKWQEGDGNITVNYSGEGNDLLSISTETNEGLDREQSIILEAIKGYSGKQHTITLKQVGKREIFNVIEGEFMLQSNEFLNVLKYGVQ